MKTFCSKFRRQAVIPILFKLISFEYPFMQCLRSGSWIRRILVSWIRIRKIFGSTDPDPRGKISTKNPNLNFWKKKIIKISSILNGLSSFRIKISEKKSVNLNEMTWIRIWIRINFFFSAIPRSGFASKLMDPKHCFHGCILHGQLKLRYLALFFNILVDTEIIRYCTPKLWFHVKYKVLSKLQVETRV